MTKSNSLGQRLDVDPMVKGLADILAEQFTLAKGVEEARRQLRALVLPTPDDLAELRIENHLVGVEDLVDVPIRIYWPPAGQRTGSPIVVFYHGGGFATGDLETYDTLARMHAVHAEAIVVSVDYRLAPEHPYPAAIDDAWSALRWVGKHAANLGGDPRRIAVAGDSAGGNISAVMTHLVRDNGGPQLAFQLLWYPATTIDFTLPAVRENADAPILTADMMTTFMRWYHPACVDEADPSALPVTLAPANAVDLSGLPPAYIAIADHDPLRDDGSHYAELLRAAGVPTQLDHSPTLVHGYLNFVSAVPAAAEAFDRGMAALRAGLRGGRHHCLEDHDGR